VNANEVKIYMASCCSKKPIGGTKFTVLFVYVLNVLHLLALEGSSVYARQLVERCFRKYTKINFVLVGPHVYKF
jgi:hypothetical protein